MIESAGLSPSDKMIFQDLTRKTTAPAHVPSVLQTSSGRFWVESRRVQSPLLQPSATGAEFSQMVQTDEIGCKGERLHWDLAPTDAEGDMGVIPVEARGFPIFCNVCDLPALNALSL